MAKTPRMTKIGWIARRTSVPSPSGDNPKNYSNSGQDNIPLLRTGVRDEVIPKALKLRNNIYVFKI
jgi:hypothetical protein